MKNKTFNEVCENSMKRFADCPLGGLVKFDKAEKSLGEYDKPLSLIVDVEKEMKNCPIEGNDGHWDGKRGNSTWMPDKEYSPRKANPDAKTWDKLLDKYVIEGIVFKDGEPNFSEISKGNVEIEPFTDSRTDNFDKADIEMAKGKGCSPEEVAKWRKEHKYTWHECKDMKNMQKVPSEVHNNIPHSGGISEAKKINNQNNDLGVNS